MKPINVPTVDESGRVAERSQRTSGGDGLPGAAAAVCEREGTTQECLAFPFRLRI